MNFNDEVIVPRRILNHNKIFTYMWWILSFPNYLKLPTNICSFYWEMIYHLVAIWISNSKPDPWIRQHYYPYLLLRPLGSGNETVSYYLVSDNSNLYRFTYMHFKNHWTALPLPHEHNIIPIFTCYLTLQFK